ncbi:MAG TPA: lysophospholipid acyltransferase family protein [Rectinemataceae bacterium]|nr:lysophospholipid acyltransferase family protein [Rectinemataceae bacterium]
MKTLRGILGWAAAIGVFLAIVLGLLLLPLFGGRRRWDGVLRSLARGLVACFGIRVETRGEAPQPSSGGTVIVCNHVNFLDGFILYGHLPLHFRILEQKEHFSWPVWGYLSKRFGNIPLDQSGGGGTARALLASRHALAEGSSILVFPEAHRTRDGRIAGFYRGAFRLARSCEAPIVPVVICEVWDVYRRGGSAATPGKMELEILPAWEPELAASMDEKALRGAVRGVMAAALDEGRERLTRSSRDKDHRLAPPTSGEP